MTTAPPPARYVAAGAQVAQLIDDTKAQLDELYQQRRRLMLRMADSGLTHRAISQAVKIANPMVTTELRRARREAGRPAFEHPLP